MELLDRSGRTALEWAKEKGEMEVVIPEVEMEMENTDRLVCRSVSDIYA